MFVRRTGRSWGGRADDYCDGLSSVSIWSLRSLWSVSDRWEKKFSYHMETTLQRVPSVLISVTWVQLLWAVYKFFRINNIDLKCSFVRCRKYHKSRWNGASELHISVDLLCGTTAAELHNYVDLLCATTATELHNSVDLLCGTTAAETFERWTFWRIQQRQIDSRTFSKLLKYVRFTKIQQTFKDEDNKRPQKTLADARITTSVSSSKWGKT